MTLRFYWSPMDSPTGPGESIPSTHWNVGELRIPSCVDFQRQCTDEDRRPYSKGVYPTDADSIGIPLMETAFMSVAGGALLVLALAASAFSLVLAPRVSRPWRLVLTAAHVLAHAGCVAFFLLWAASWLTPHHYPIATSCLLVAAAIAYFWVSDVRRLRSNN